MATGSKLQFEPGSWLEALYDVYTGIVVGAAHPAYLLKRWGYVHLTLPLLNAFGTGLQSDKPVISKDRERTLKVIAVGYGRTGTVRH